MGSERNHQVPALAGGQDPPRPPGSLLLHGGKRDRGILLLGGRAGQYLARGLRGRAPALMVRSDDEACTPPRPLSVIDATA